MYNKKDMTLQTFKLKCGDCDNKESLYIEKADGILIEMIRNTVLSFCLMNDRMQFSGPDLFNYLQSVLQWMPELNGILLHLLHKKIVLKILSFRLNKPG